MKSILFFCSLVACLCLQEGLYGQAATEISGTIKSASGSIQGAQVGFYSLDNEFLGNCISGPLGKFTSEKKMTVGSAVRLKISATGFKTAQKDIKVIRGGDAGEFMLDRKALIITGFVRDSITVKALTGAEVFFYDEQGTLLLGASTNSLGYYEMETQFVYGQKITVRVSKKGYYDDQEQTLTFTSDGRNNLPDILLAELGTRGLRAYIRVRDKKSGDPLGGGTVRYFDRKLSTFINTPVPDNGELELKLYQPPGTSLDAQVVRPKYRSFTLKAILSGDPLNNVFTCELERGR